MADHDMSYNEWSYVDESLDLYLDEDMTIASFENAVGINGSPSAVGESEYLIHRLTWNLIVPEEMAFVSGFDKRGVVHLIESYSTPREADSATLYDHYFAYGKTLERIRADYQNNAGMLWRMAQMVVPRFPHHTVGNQPKVLDPFDGLPSVYMDYSLYAEVSVSGNSNLPICVSIDPPLAGRSLRPRCELHYDSQGKLGGFSSFAMRNEKEWMLRILADAGEWYVAEISTAERSFGVLRGKHVLHSGNREKYMGILRDRGIIADGISRKSTHRSSRNSTNASVARYMWSDFKQNHQTGLYQDAYPQRPIIETSPDTDYKKLTEEEISRITVDCGVSHKTFGNGVIVSIDGSYVMVKFPDKERRFQWPTAFEAGILSLNE